MFETAQDLPFPVLRRGSCSIDLSDIRQCTITRFPFIIYNKNSLTNVNTQIQVFVVNRLGTDIIRTDSLEVLIKLKIIAISYSARCISSLCT